MKTKPALTNSPDSLKHGALRRLREQLGLTAAEMAERLGVSLSWMHAHEYNRIPKIPPDVLERARQLEIDPEYAYARAMFEDRPMADIVSQWSDRAGVERGNAAALARVLGVAKSTVSRWLTDDASRPTLAMLARYDRRVEAEEKWIESRKEARRYA